MTTTDFLATAWTGRAADFVSPSGEYGPIPHSELAMHTRHAGKPCVRYALFFTPDHGRVTWAHVQTSDGRVLDGLPWEVLPWGIRRQHNL
jgi:hypothetical protein